MKVNVRSSDTRLIVEDGCQIKKSREDQKPKRIRWNDCHRKKKWKDKFDDQFVEGPSLYKRVCESRISLPPQTVVCKRATKTSRNEFGLFLNVELATEFLIYSSSFEDVLDSSR